MREKKNKLNTATSWECSAIHSLPHSADLGGAQAWNGFCGSPQLPLNLLLQERELQRFPGFPFCPTEAPVPLRTTKILSLQAVLFKPIFLNTKYPSLSLKQQPRNEGNEGTFPQVLLGFFLGKAGQEFVRSGLKACKGPRNCSPHTFSRLSATTPHFCLRVTSFGADNPLVFRAEHKGRPVTNGIRELLLRGVISEMVLFDASVSIRINSVFNHHYQ